MSKFIEETRKGIPITEGRVCKGGQNPPNMSDKRPPAPGGSGGRNFKKLDDWGNWYEPAPEDTKMPDAPPPPPYTKAEYEKNKYASQCEDKDSYGEMIEIIRSQRKDMDRLGDMYDRLYEQYEEVLETDNEFVKERDELSKQLKHISSNRDYWRNTAVSRMNLITEYRKAIAELEDDDDE